MNDAYAISSALEQASRDLKDKYQQVREIVMEAYFAGDLPSFHENDRQADCKLLLVQAQSLFLEHFKQEMIEKHGEQRIAVYGGSFDPPTIGHVMVCSHLNSVNNNACSYALHICYYKFGQ